MSERLAGMPRSVVERAKLVRLGDTQVPTLLAHPDWQTPAPVVLWMHGRTVNKELDPGRYARWLRAGVGVCAIDLPGHGERGDARPSDPANSLALIEEALGEIDSVIDALSIHDGVFDQDRLGIGGMSLGGMVALRRLCEPHTFKAASVEATTGSLEHLYLPGPDGKSWPVKHDPARVKQLDPAAHLAEWRAIPVQVLHSEADEMVPWATQERFVGLLRERYEEVGSDPSLVEVRTWPETGAPSEHIGFGRESNEAKTLQVEFWVRHLAPVGFVG
ncbi:MAG: prolyl oligopeptidase family serine peptidase [Phycisphaeraceae bacterium]|nr:prolyl oligopeptidase family serine peptidase [Phycisphaeraceae bacterium]MCW5763932.1 prolyl oligopeptidase family serine peptidase [Phycisphaeraceae bacterium]